MALLAIFKQRRVHLRGDGMQHFDFVDAKATCAGRLCAAKHANHLVLQHQRQADICANISINRFAPHQFAGVNRFPRQRPQRSRHRRIGL